MRLHDVLDYQARERPSAEFAVQGNRSLTYREALLEVHQLAHALVSAGLQIGDRVAILATYTHPEEVAPEEVDSRDTTAGKIMTEGMLHLRQHVADL